MKKILIVDDEQPIRDLLQLLIESEFENEILLAVCGNEAQELLAADNDIGVILSDYNMPNGNGGELYTYNNNGPNLPFILVTGGFLEDYPEMIGFLEDDKYYRNVLSKPFDEEELYSEIRKGLEQYSKEPTSVENSEYKKVDIDNFIRFLNRYSLSLDIFLRISGEKIIKIFSENDTIDEDDLKKYKSDKQSEILLKSNDFESLKVRALNEIAVNLKNASSFSEALEATSVALNFYMTGESLFKISSNQVEIVQTSVESCLRNFENNSELKDYFKVLKKDKGYLIAHSITTLNLCFMLMKESGLYSVENMERLSYASLLHDCELTDFSHSAVINKTDENFLQLDKKEQDAVIGHPQWAADLAIKLNVIPNDVEAIIRMHHEKPDGTGYPRGLNRNNFTVISALFVICFRLADHLYYHEGDKEKLDEFLKNLEENYSTGPFKTPWQALSKIIK